MIHKFIILAGIYIVVCPAIIITAFNIFLTLQSRRIIVWSGKLWDDVDDEDDDENDKTKREEGDKGEKQHPHDLHVHVYSSFTF